MEILIDFIVKLPPTGPNRYTNLIVITDKLTKSVIIKPLADLKVITVARAFIRVFYQYYGPLIAIISDKGA